MKWAFDTLRIPGLGPTERAVLYFLCWKHHHKTGACCPAMATIAEYAGVSERRARDAVRALEAAGLVQSARRCGQAGNSSNQYTLLPFRTTVEIGTKKPGEIGSRVPIPDRNTAADDRESLFVGPEQGFLAKKKSKGGNA